MAINEKRHYFDWAASAAAQDTGIHDIPCGNPSSLHSEGREAKNILENARIRCAAALNVPSDTVFFTSGGTESNSIALFSMLKSGSPAGYGGGKKTIASLAEHPSVRQALAALDKMGRDTGSIEVDSSGKVTPDLLAKSLQKNGNVRFAAVMSVNNETGTVTDIPSLTGLIRHNSKAPVHFHCDLVQAVGKIPVDISSWDIDSASISAHKIGGPRGIGLLYLRKPSSFEVFYKGGGQESGIRGGTENVKGAAQLSYCLEKFACKQTLHENYKKAKARWQRLITSLAGEKRCTIIPGERLKETQSDAFSPYILQAAFNDIPGEVMARALDDLGFAVSTGSACSSSSPERPVLEAMGVSEKLRIEGIRISQGYSTTDEEIDLLIEAIREVLSFL